MRGKYLKVSLSAANGKIKQESVHRLVAMAFHPNPNKLPIVNHKDENKLNNSADNLEWCSHEYNNNYGARNEKAANTLKTSKNYPDIVQLDLEGNEIAVYKSQHEAARVTGVPQGNIYKVCAG